MPFFSGPCAVIGKIDTMLDWWRCHGRCGKKIRQSEVVWLLTGPAGFTLDGAPTRPEPYCLACSDTVPLKRQWHGGVCQAMPTIMGGNVVCPECGAAFVEHPNGIGLFHP